MSRTWPLLHIATIALLVVPAVVLMAPERAPADDQPAGKPTTITAADWPATPAAERGRAVYEDYCIGCHGVDGRGDGEAARWLDPKPRNFQRGHFKFVSTRDGTPSVDDLVRTITCGLPGSSMPGFPLVPEHERRDVARYVQHLMGFGLAENEVGFLLEDGLTMEEIRRDELPTLRAEFDARLAGASRRGVPNEPERTPELLARGHELFVERCATCHGDVGLGDGPSSFALRDWKDTRIDPRDLTTGVFRAGGSAADLFTRLGTGLAGTPMPATSLPDDDLWALVFAVQDMRDPNAPEPTWGGCGGLEGDK